MAKTQMTNNGGNRSLVVYCYKDNFTDEERFSFNEEICEILQNIGGLNEKYIIDDPRTVNVALTSGEWARLLKIGNCSGDFLVGVYFYNQPEPEPEPEPEIVFVPSDELGNPVGEPVYEDVEPEPEPPSIPQLVCEALASALEDGKAGASAFVISPEMSEFELEVQ